MTQRQRGQKLARGLGGEGLVLGDGDPEPSFDPKQQLHSCQAVEPQVVVELAVQRRHWAATRMKLGGNLLDEIEQSPTVDGQRARRSVGPEFRHVRHD